MKTKIKKKPIGADEIEVIHPHNDALQIIDDKIQKLVDTHQHVLTIRNKHSGYRVDKTQISKFKNDSDDDMLRISNRLKALEKSRKLIWEFGTFEAMQTFKSDE